MFGGNVVLKFCQQWIAMSAAVVADTNTTDIGHMYFSTFGDKMLGCKLQQLVDLMHFAGLNAGQLWRLVRNHCGGSHSDLGEFLESELRRCTRACMGMERKRE